MRRARRWLPGRPRTVPRSRPYSPDPDEDSRPNGPRRRARPRRRAIITAATASTGPVDDVAALAGQQPGRGPQTVISAACGGRSLVLAASWRSGMCRAPGACRARHSGSSRTSSRIAPCSCSCRPAAGWPWAGPGTDGEASRSSCPPCCLRGDEPQARIGDAGVLVVDGHHRPPAASSKARPRRVTRAAVHPYLAWRDLANAGAQIVPRDVERALDVAACPFGRSADVQDGDRPVAADGGQVSEARDRDGRPRPPAGPSPRGAGGAARQLVDADPVQVRLRGDDLSRWYCRTGSAGFPGG